jgi:hypothetical protein
MSYQTIQTAVLAMVHAYDTGATFTVDTAAEDDWRVLDNSVGDIAAVVTQAGDTLESYELNGRGRHGYRYAQHEVGVMVASAIRTDQDTDAIQALYATVQGLSAWLRKYPLLNGAAGVKHAQIVRTTRRRPIAPVSDETRSTHWSQMIVVQVVEEIALSVVEAGG